MGQGRKWRINVIPTLIDALHHLTTTLAALVALVTLLHLTGLTLVAADGVREDWSRAALRDRLDSEPALHWQALGAVAAVVAVGYLWWLVLLG